MLMIFFFWGSAFFSSLTFSYCSLGGYDGALTYSIGGASGFLVSFFGDTDG